MIAVLMWVIAAAFVVGSLFAVDEARAMLSWILGNLWGIGGWIARAVEKGRAK